MKLLTIVLTIAGVATISGAFAVGCGPKKQYCPENSTGLCNDANVGVMPMPMDSGPGDAVIIGGDV
jgi:hypothetical protein